MLHGAEADRRAGRLLEGDAVRHLDDEALRPVDEFAGKAVDVKTHDAGDVLAEIVAALPAALQCPQVSAPYIATASPGLKRVTPSPTASTAPEASTPTTSGSLRLAKAMPRKPQTSR